ncbi:putative virion structural protein [Erwinia phage vB_EamM_RAY]|uniref:Virion structural protein n=9 Tax=Agricanvirus TaxID=1984776 RepID=A0A173GE32_9CAUD|nr:hypothetical protein Ea357_178 [Erwinia phage Ea35-70]YP_009605329.1 putative virion structural protein [Erwinia phage vB_EamM_Deimos-Minion]YP_009605647.1 putative virion structural protein [Erwinia phage vB_EamM_RAY]YP_009605967.1 hypothetical protein FDH99_gp183 [Erwinia phage vB_EamM_Simmy50]YP_009621922.1 putative virion structural protein [Erwinia phage vB_EamM_Desertfox]AUG85969.1 putative virion structural protein [Erwinia phage vB_EamM_Bosolaphorus]AUG86610.1 putative virion struc
MFKSPYDTTTARWTPGLEGIRKELRVAKIERRLTSASTPLPVSDPLGASPSPSDKLWYVVSGVPGNERIPPFMHPLEFTDTLGRTNMAIDLRSAIGMAPDGRTLVVRNRNGQLDAEQLIIRLKATAYWMLESSGPRDLMNLSGVPMRIFARWITENISRRVGLDYDAVPRYLVYASWYYFCLFFNKEQMSDDLRLIAINKIATQGGLRRDIVADVLQDVGYVGSISEFCETAQAVVGADQLSLVDVKTLITLAGNAWFGQNAKEGGGVALEYPPLFLSMLYGAMGNKAYRNTAIGTIADRKDYQRDGAVFTRAFVGTIND